MSDAASTALVKADEELFRKATPSIVRTVLPVTWLWHFATRRFSFLRGLGASRWRREDGKEPTAELLADGVMYGEGPRFRVQENALYFSDMFAQKVYKYDLATKRTSVAFECADDYVSGLGWLPDGRMLVVAMNSKRVLVVDAATREASEYADVSAVTRFRANDFVVDVSGRAYVGNFGFDYSKVLTASKTTLVRIDTDQSVHVAATGLFFPNGSVITPDGKTLIIAETFDAVLTAFDIGADGTLSNRRVWADVGVPCDGIALDAEGCVWVSVPQIGLYKTAGGLVRVKEGGEVVDVLGFGMNGITNCVFACQLGTDAATGKHYVYFLESEASEEHIVLAKGPEQARKNTVLKAIEVPVGPARIAGNERYCGGYC